MRPARPPVVLIIDDQEWTARSLESILAPSGFAVMRAYTGAKGWERAQKHAPDAVIVDAQLPDSTGAELVQRLREIPHVGSRTPIIVSSTERPSRDQRMAAFRAGAWDYVVSPVDAEELVLRLEGYTNSKFESDQIREEGLVDEVTGLYNVKGLERRVEEVKSWAYRERDAMACLVVSPSHSAPEAPESADVAQQIAEVLKSTGRISDVMGRLGTIEFAVIAPSTNAAGAIRLSERLRDALSADGQNGLRIGYDAVGNVRETPGEAQDLLMRATMALRKSRTQDDGWLTAYRDVIH